MKAANHRRRRRRPRDRPRRMRGRRIGNGRHEPDPVDRGIEHPTGSDQVVLRVADEGGFVPVDYMLSSMPSFSLYGDGTLITPGAQIDIYPGPALALDPAAAR